MVDLTLFRPDHQPQLSASVNPLLNLEYDRHFYSGTLHVRLGYTHDAWFDNRAKRFGTSEDRDYILADGSFKISDNWRWGFTAQHVNDPNDDTTPSLHTRYGDNANFFDRYSIENVFDPVGELTVDSRARADQPGRCRPPRSTTPTSRSPWPASRVCRSWAMKR
ncbi:MAG: hypothetical protein WDN06_19225 [Asticcacaulis sp.]